MYLSLSNSLFTFPYFVTPWTVAHQAPLSMGFSRQEYWSGLPFPSPFPYFTFVQMKSHCLYLVLCCLQSCLTFCDPMDCNPPGSSVHGISQARILEWVTISFSRGSSQLRDQTHVSCLAGGFLTTEPLQKPMPQGCHSLNYSYTLLDASMVERVLKNSS